MRMHVVPSKSIPLSLTIYHHVDNNTRSFSLLSLITEFDVNKFHPFHVEVTHGNEDLTNFCFLQREMSDSYAITFSNDAEKLSVHALTTLLKSKEITSFLFIPCAHQILLDYFATSHTLPKIARGSISPLTCTVLKHSHPLKLLQQYHICAQMTSPILQASAKQKLSDLCYHAFDIRPSKVLKFKIQSYEVLSKNKIRTLLSSFLKTLPISSDMRTLLQLQTRVIFSRHPKISTIFTNHITWCKKWSLKPFPCACHKIAPSLGITLSVDNPHISVLGPDTTSSFDRILHCNMNNAAVPNIRSFPEEFFMSFHNYYDEACSFSHKFSEIFSCTPKYPTQLFSRTKL